MPVCSECNSVLISPKALYLHSSIVHLKSKSDHFKCGEEGCYTTLSNWGQFRKHLSKHKCNNSVVPNLNQNADTQLSGNEEYTESNLFSNDESSVSHSETENFDVLAKEHVIRYLAKLYANHQLPRSFVQTALDDTLQLFTDMISCLKPKLRQILKHSNVSSETISTVTKTVDSLLDPFATLGSEHLRFKELKDSGCFVKDTDHVIGARVDDVVKKGVSSKQIVPVNAKFLSMRSVLQKVFSLPEVFHKTKAYAAQLEQETEILENFVQGQLWRKKVAVHFKDKVVFPLLVYFDDFEVNNPLGSHAGIAKVGAIYYSVMCFPPEFRSQLENIFVAMLFYASDRVQYSNALVFQILINELNFLQSEGILIDTGNGTERVYFSLGLIAGDNLGLNSILGFVEGFNATYYCRLCKTRKLDARIDFDEKNLRRESYANDVIELNVKETGTKEASVWDNVEHFKTSENFYSDWLHEGPEGQAFHDMCLIVHHYVCLKTKKDHNLSLDLLNSRLRSFNYLDNGITNPPPLITVDEAKGKHLKMSASEMQNFILIFSMLVGDLVSHDSDVWRLYLMLRQIMDIVLTRRIQKGGAPLLRNLVKEHHILFNQVFPEEHIKPKGHLWVHLGTVLEQSGPIINLSTARFESKHRHKKIEAHATSSRKNIIHTLCLKEQLVLCHRLLTKKGFTSNKCDGPYECLDHISLCDNYFLFKHSLPKAFIGPCLVLNWIKINGQIYRQRTCVLIGLEGGSDEMLPVFGLVEKIIENLDGEVCLICKHVNSTGFDPSLHAYKMCEYSKIVCVYLSDLLSPFNCIVSALGQNNTFATIRHSL